AAGLPLIAGEQLSFQRVLAGFRLLMRDIGGEAARMKEIVDGVAAGTDAWKAGPPPAPATAVEQHAPSADPAVLGRLDAIDVALRDIESKVAAAAPTRAEGEMAETSAAALPLLNDERDSMQRLLVGFRLQLRELDAQTSELRDKIAGIRQPETLVLAPEIDAGMLAPLHGAAERIAEGVAETLSQLEQRLSEPVSRLTDAVADNAGMLSSAHAAMAAPAKTASAEGPATLRAAVEAMQDAARSIDGRIGQVDQLLATLRKGGALGSDLLGEVVSGMEAAATDLRREAGDFLAIGAALTHELEAADGGGAETPARRRKIAAAVKTRAA
ncbi:MAG: hypothetical protein ACRCTI_02555, partial [Beijerinckiaceae bacterium]